MLDDNRAEAARFIHRAEVNKADPKRRRRQPVGERVEVVWRGALTE